MSLLFDTNVRRLVAPGKELAPRASMAYSARFAGESIARIRMRKAIAVIIFVSCLSLPAMGCSPGQFQDPLDQDPVLVKPLQQAVDNARLFQAVAEETNPCISAEDIALLDRMMGIRPTCNELKRRDDYRGRRVGSDLIWVIPDPSRNYYYVVGFRLPEEGGDPAMGWTGARLSGAIDQSCDPKTDGNARSDPASNPPDVVGSGPRKEE